MNKWFIVFAIFVMACCGYGAWHLFPKAFPIVQIELTSSRDEILSKAKEQACLWLIDPTTTDASCKNAISFDTDITAQTFIELEGGGTQVFADVLAHHYYEPYLWHVRLFVPHQLHEASLFFTPTGHLYGFKEKISENETGINLSSDDALQKAVTCTKNLNIDLTVYNLVETSQQTQIAGRIDHTFVYERQDMQLNEGKYRLTITVAGDKVIACRRFIKVPESFERRHQEMRSYNNMLAFVALLLIVFLYLLGACCASFYFYVKQQLFCWKPALLCAAFIALFNLINQINQLPLLLIQYDTVTSLHMFLLRQILMAIFGSIMSFAFFSLIIVVAEGLTRKAFSEHIQLWQIWKQGCANSTPVGIITLNGYVLACIDLLLVVVTYFVTTRYAGWWSPSYALIDPNIIATYIPALNSLALSLQAGFIEECLFRAIPLAASALLGRYFKKERSFLLIGFIIQAFVFGAAHANYPAQPFYARLVELIIPSFMWGIFYIRYGLLPIIICHVLYDIVWFSLPIFISHAAGMWIQKLIIILCSCIPLLIVLYHYIKTKQWHTDVSLFVNKAWQPSIKEEKTVTKHEVRFLVYNNNIMRGSLILLIAIAKLLSILHLSKSDKLSTHLPPKTEVVDLAQNVISSYKTTNWDYIKSAQPMPFLSFDSEAAINDHRYIWQMERKQYHTMLEKGYISLPGWAVRYAHFDGDILKRAEQLIVRINRNKDLLYVFRTVPQNQEGAHCTEQQALTLALHAIHEKYALAADTDLLLKTVVPFKEAHRTDWTITYTVLSDNVLQEGEPRVQVIMVGDTISTVKKYIHVPEAWERNFKNDLYYLSLLKSVGLFALLLCALLLLTYIVNTISLSVISFKYVLLFCVAIMGITCANWFNILPITISQFNTVEPWSLQMGRAIGLFLIQNSIFILSTTFLFFCAASIQWPTAYLNTSLVNTWPVGLIMGIVFGLSSGIISPLLILLNGISLPVFYEHSIAFANSYVPSLYIVCTTITHFLRFFAAGLLCLYVLRMLSFAKMHYIILLCGALLGLPIFIAPASVIFSGYMYVSLLCMLFFLIITLLMRQETSPCYADKRVVVGFITGLYVSNLYLQHCVLRVSVEELIGGTIAMCLILVISLLFCKKTEHETCLQK